MVGRQPSFVSSFMRSKGPRRRRAARWRMACLTACLAGLGCGRSSPPPKPPETAAPASDEVVLRYAAEATTLREQLELQLTHQSIGRYLEATAKVVAQLAWDVDGETMTVHWTIDDVEALELTGSVGADDTPRTDTLLRTQGKGTTIGTLQGTLDANATDAEPANVARLKAMTSAGRAVPPISGVMLMTSLADHLGLPPLPTEGLELGREVEVTDELETVIPDGESDLVLPTTRVHRFTLQSIDEQRVATVAVAIASVAELLPELDPEAAAEGDGADGEPPEPLARLESQANGTLLFDVDNGIPLRFELSRNESFHVGEAEGERSVLVQARYERP